MRSFEIKVRHLQLKVCTAKVQENCHLREELGLDLETPLDWESEDESEAPENGEVGSLDADTDTEKG
ncbi:unnamed protein product [Effrenium voratum]|nr:unnamed protein product [Effrenium voratum]